MYCQVNAVDTIDDRYQFVHKIIS